nr:MAG TPA: hypothetical protein [Bacteriophage sp.]
MGHRVNMMIQIFRLLVIGYSIISLEILKTLME